VGSTLALAHPLYYDRLVQLASTIFGTIRLNSSLRGCVEPYLRHPVSLYPRSALSMSLHTGDNVQFKFGGREIHLYTLCSVFSFILKKKKEFIFVLKS
jgi:hypothetical protein